MGRWRAENVVVTGSDLLSRPRSSDLLEVNDGDRWLPHDTAHDFVFSATGLKVLVSVVICMQIGVI